MVAEGSGGELDCRSCGICCGDASDGRVGVSAEDLVRWKRERRHDILDGLIPGHFGVLAFPARPSGACVHQGTAESPIDCSIYETRAAPCRQVQAGDRECLAYRRVFFAAQAANAG
jgi:Fe-S-cluster containining protein